LCIFITAMDIPQQAAPRKGLTNQPSLLVILFAVVFAFWFVDFWRPYNPEKGHHNFNADVMNYYSFLPATFCNGGSFDFHWGADSLYIPFGPKNTFVPKCTYGMSVMYAPFFALGYKIAINQNDRLDGFSEAFSTTVRWGSIAYVLIGLLFLRAFLITYFSERTVAITLAAVFFGSMLFNYALVQSELTHGYLFTLFSAFLWLTARWYRDRSIVISAAVGLVAGLVSLIRPTEVYILFFFVLWEIHRVSDIGPRLKLYRRSVLQFVIMILVVAGLWIPQLLFWKSHTGRYFYYPYLDEKFFWNDPQLLNILFSYRKGWLTYTPVILLAFIGMAVKGWDRLPFSRWSVIAVTAVTLYVLSCWWDWSFGGCFGARAFCQHIAFLSIPMALAIERVLSGFRKRIITQAASLCLFVFVFSCVCLNIGQTYQSLRTLIHPWATTRDLYWYVFRRYQFGNDFEQQYWSRLKFIDHEKWMKGEGRSDR
jgi:hypothetical protein